MKKPKRSENKYWQGTSNFDHLKFEQDLQEYANYLEVTNRETVLKLKRLLIKVENWVLVESVIEAIRREFKLNDD